MFEFEKWKNEIVDSINQLQEETKLIREHLEEDFQEKEKNTKENEVDEEVQEILEDEQLELFNLEDNENEIIILEKLDELNKSINILNKSVIESSIVLAITIVLALAFHYFVNQLSKW